MAGPAAGDVVALVWKKPVNAILKPVPLEFRQMLADDLQRVMEIELEVYPFPWTEGIFQDCLRAGYRAIVCCYDAEIIGYGMMSIAAGEAHLLNLCIHPVQQGNGYGRELLEQLLDVAVNSAVGTVFLEVRASNIAAQQLYLRSEFNEIGFRPGYYPGDGGREDALVYARAIIA